MTKKSDPVFDAFLGFLEQEIARRPDLLSLVTQHERHEADELLAVVQSDKDADLGASFRLPAHRPHPPTPRRASRTPKG